MYNPSEYPEGVPNPYYPNVNLYPSNTQGPDYTRPVFDLPWSARPYNVLSGVGADWWDVQGNVDEYHAAERGAFWKGVAAATGFGAALAILSGNAARGNELAKFMISFGMVGLLASGVTYATWPKILGETS